MMYELYRRNVPYWMDIPDSDGTDNNDEDPFTKLAKRVVGSIILLIIGMALCSLLPGCSSTRIDKERKIDTVTEEHKTETSIDTSNVSISNTTIEKLLEDIDSWWDIHYEKILWSEPDSNGNQHIISKETLDKSGGSHKTRQDTITSSTAVDLHAGASHTKVEDEKTTYKEDDKETIKKSSLSSKTRWTIGIGGAIGIILITLYIISKMKGLGITTIIRNLLHKN